MRAGALGVLANLCALAIALSGCKPEIVDAVELGICARSAPPSTCPTWRDPITIPKTSTNVGTTAGTWMRAGNKIVTRWAPDVDPGAPHPEYPRPQLVRPEWAPLNGLWDYAFVPMGSPAPATWDGKVLVPFAVEAALSGVGKSPMPTEAIVYHRTFDVPQEWQGRHLVLRFGAVDYETTVSLNHQQVGQHKGGYDGFSFDVTSLLDPSGPQDLVVSVIDRTNDTVQPRGKQSSTPSGIYYTAVSGIWQTVWLEPVPESRIDNITIVPNVDNSRFELSPTIAGATTGLTADVFVFENSQLDDAKLVAQASGPAGQRLDVTIPNPELWSTNTDAPQLYGLRVNLRRDDVVLDSVGSYAGLRKISAGQSAGSTRILFNDQPVFQVGVLDQGYWPDGLYTAPTDEALDADVVAIKQLGFNAVRKHVKIEPDTWYWHCDRHGLNVWQDMPSGGVPLTDADKQQFTDELLAMVDGRRNHPSIMTWIAYNADWGLYDKTTQLAQLVSDHDPSRLVDYTSGLPTAAGTVSDTHSYVDPDLAPTILPDAVRPAIIGEFGGIGLRNSDNHSWTTAMFDTSKEPAASADALTARFAAMMKTLYQLRDTKGISGGIYTQLTDIETEDNGLYTYDRELKLPIGDVQAAIRGQ